MAEYPLLFFPSPAKATRSKQGGGAVGFNKPTMQRQRERLAPKFDLLRAAFVAEQADIQGTVTGVDPEQVLVFETIGSVEDFASAAKRIDGFEWLGEIELDEIAPDADFYDENDPNKNLKGRCYLILSNLRAFEELLSLWDRYQNDPQMKWEHGFAKYRDVFQHLKDIRHWGIPDRLDETGILKYWKETLAETGDQPVRFEIELWYRKDAKSREKSIENVSKLITSNGGNVLATSTIEPILYIGLLVELPVNIIQEVSDRSDVKLVKSNDIMFFRATGQMTVGRHLAEGEVEHTLPDEAPLPQGDPIIAILDGLPLANHRLLEGRLYVDDPDNWEADYLAKERKHGTAMASLVIHGDLNESFPSPPSSRPVYIRPIFKPSRWVTTSSGQTQEASEESEERVPSDCLLVDLIHRAVKRLFEGEAGESPVAPNIKVINLSLGDKARHFFQFNSPLARLLDWLSLEYNVLFVVSAGNHCESITLDVDSPTFQKMTDSEREALTVKTLYQDLRNRRLLSPAESINAITVGALHFDTSIIQQIGYRVDLLKQLLPSPVSAFGSGYRRSVKPDLVFNGGRQLYTQAVSGQAGHTEMELRLSLNPPGIKAAHPGQIPGELNATSHSCGTSNATALMSRAVGQCYDVLSEITHDNAAIIDSSQEIALLKAMLVHGCTWGEIAERIDSILQSPTYSSKRMDFKKHISRWLGYGTPQVSRVLKCTGQRVTLLGYGALHEEKADVFHLPLPPSLNGEPVLRRLTVTLTWISPISPGTQKYRTAHLWFALEDKDGIATNRKEIDWQEARRGTVQHEIFEGERAVPYPEDEMLAIKVNCKKDAGKITSPVSYGLAVSLEVAEGTNLPIYNEVQTRLRPIIPVRPVAEN